MKNRLFSRKWLTGWIGAAVCAYLHSKGKHEAAQAIEWLLSVTIGGEAIGDAAQRWKLPPSDEK